MKCASLLPYACCLLFLSCKEAPQPLKFREKPAQSTSASAPASTSLPVASLPTTTSAPSAGFTCNLDGVPWQPKPDGRYQGLIIHRASTNPEQPPAELITAVLQNKANESLLLEMPFAKGEVDGAKLTFTTKDNIAKGEAHVLVSALEGADGKYLLTASFSAELQELGGQRPRQLSGCALSALPLRALSSEPDSEE